MTNFCFRTSFAGVPVSKKIERASMAISKKFKSLRCTCGGDKAVYFTMDDNEFRALKREHQIAKLDYLIEIEGEDYTAF